MSDTVAADQLRLFIKRIARLEEEKKGMSEGIRDVYNQARSTGSDGKTMRAIVRLPGTSRKRSSKPTTLRWASTDEGVVRHRLLDALGGLGRCRNGRHPRDGAPVFVRLRWGVTTGPARPDQFAWQPIVRQTTSPT
jgi:uncharacterized protein (UPF0335 family)